jgi:hypothetical protein
VARRPDRRYLANPSLSFTLCTNASWTGDTILQSYPRHPQMTDSLRLISKSLIRVSLSHFNSWELLLKVEMDRALVNLGGWSVSANSQHAFVVSVFVIIVCE